MSTIENVITMNYWARCFPFAGSKAGKSCCNAFIEIVDNFAEHARSHRLLRYTDGLLNTQLTANNTDKRKLAEKDLDFNGVQKAEYWLH